MNTHDAAVLLITAIWLLIGLGAYVYVLHLNNKFANEHPEYPRSRNRDHGYHGSIFMLAGPTMFLFLIPPVWRFQERLHLKQLRDYYGY